MSITNNAINNGGTLTTIYTADDTFIKNSRTRVVQCTLIGGGAGGGSGRKGTAGSSGGGGGGSGGHVMIATFPADFFNSAGETVVVGQGGTGGAAQSTDATNGISGSNGTASSIGNIRTQIAIGGSFGATATVPGTSNTITILNLDGSQVGNNLQVGIIGGSGKVIAGESPDDMPSSDGSGNSSYNINASYLYLPTCGGGGAGSKAAAPAYNGARGGDIYSTMNQQEYNTAAQYETAFILGGLASGGNGNTGHPAASSITGGRIFGGTGGGGGDGAVTATSAAQNGGTGGIPGGGGGGGGGGISAAYNSGAGGSGGRGVVIVTEYF